MEVLIPQKPFLKALQTSKKNGRFPPGEGPACFFVIKMK
jgi:hypothetical protein